MPGYIFLTTCVQPVEKLPVRSLHAVHVLAPQLHTQDRKEARICEQNADSWNALRAREAKQVAYLGGKYYSVVNSGL